jgi:hypothetical protein
MRRLTYVATGVCLLLFAMLSGAQSTSQGVTQTSSNAYPKIEVPVDFSFINVHPDLPIITSCA